MIEPDNWAKTKLVMWLAGITPKCHEVTRLLSQSLDAPLPLRTRISLKLHFQICVWCERYATQIAAVRTALQACPEHGLEKMHGGLSPEARTRLKLALNSAQPCSGIPTTDLPPN